MGVSFGGSPTSHVKIFTGIYGFWEYCQELRGDYLCVQGGPEAGIVNHRARL